MAADRPPITVLTFFLELPYALPMESGWVNVAGIERTEHWDGWSDEQLGELIDPEDPKPFIPGMVPMTATTVRHIEMFDRPPLVVAEEAFASWFDDLFPATARQRREDREEQARGVAVTKSVVAISRFIPRTAHPRGSELTIAWLLTQFRRSLGTFNPLLEAIGLVSGRPDLGTLLLRDLPPQIRVLMTTTESDRDGQIPAVTFVAQIGQPLPEPDGSESEREVAEEAIALNNSAHAGEQPYMLVFHLIHSAEGERLAGDPTRALIDLNTAMETMLSVTLYYGQSMIGVPEADAQRASRADLKTKVRKYLAVLLEKEIDVEDEGTSWGRWFGDGYKLRNKAIHEGVTIESEAAARAFEQASAVFREVKASLELRDPLRRLGQALEVQIGESALALVDDRYLGVDLPWEEPKAG